MSEPSSSSTHPSTTNSNNNTNNGFDQALLTDTYQITMTYAHWKMNKHNDNVNFEIFFRSNPFHNGQYTIFTGLQDCLHHVRTTFCFTNDDITYLQSTSACHHMEPEFFEYLQSIPTSNLSSLQIQAIPEGTMVFPREPLMIIQGPLGICQLLETTFLNLINF